MTNIRKTLHRVAALALFSGLVGGLFCGVQAQAELGENGFAAAIEEIRTSAIEDKPQIMKLVGELFGKGHTASQAATALQEYKYARVADVLLHRLFNEGREDNPNTYVITAILDSVAVVGGESHIAELKEFEKTVRSDADFSGLKNHKFFPVIRKRLGEISGLLAKNGPGGELPVATRDVSAEGVPATGAAKNAAGQNNPVVNTDEFSFEDYLHGIIPSLSGGGKKGAPSQPESIMLQAITRFITDDIRKSRREGKENKMIGREKERDQIMDVLARDKGKNPVLLGPTGVGKTTVIVQLAEAILNKSYPATEVFSSELENAEVIETTPSLISAFAHSDDPNSQALAVEEFLEAVIETEQNIEKKTGKKKPIILFIDEIHSFEPAQLEALKRYLEREHYPIRIIGASTSEEFEISFKFNPAARRRFESIAVREFSVEQTSEILKNSWVPRFEKRYNVTVSEHALTAVIELAKYVKPGLSRPEAPFKLLQDLAVKIHRESGGKNVTITDDMVYNFVLEKTGIPSNPHKAKEFDQYIEGIRKELKTRVVGQDQMVDALVDQWSELLAGDPSRPRVILFLGPTGSGKTYLAEQFVEVALGEKSRYFEIDGTSMQDGEFSLGTYFGVPNGVRSSDQTSGTFMEYMDDPARGQMGGVIVVNEGEKMHADGWKRMMEFFDRGIVRGGDGKPRFANRHIVIITSNKGTKEVFPDTVKEWSDAEVARRLQDYKEGDIKALFLKADPEKKDLVLAPEIVGRISKAVLARPLTRDMTVSIGKLEVDKFKKRTESTYHVKLEISPELVEHLALTGTDPLEGARPIRNQVESYLSRALKAARSKWDIERDATIKLSLAEDEATGEYSITVSAANDPAKTVSTVAPKRTWLNPLEDTEIRAKLQALPKIMHDIMGEQPEAVDAIVQATVAKFGDAARQKPISITLVGTTGLGKTEMGRAMATALYGSRDRAVVLPLGDKHKEGDLQEIFGSKPGYSGHTQMWAFERALTDNPQGGVIMFDEFSNMGGDDIKVKEALIKKFYDIIEEGIWRSPRDGRIYDLKKYIFIFTGNDLEKALQGVSADDQRLAIWQKLRSKEVLHAQMLASGVPEAFLGRQDALVLMRPLNQASKERISNKLLAEFVARYEAQHRGVKIKWSEEFISLFARAFFTHDKGARSVKAVIENQVAAALTQSLLELGYERKSLAGTEIHLAMDDNYPFRPYVRGEVPLRKVNLNVSVLRGGREVYTKVVDASEAASKLPIVTREEAKLTAFHEAGHALLTLPKETGMELKYISIRGSYVKGEKVLGYARYDEILGNSGNLTRRTAVALIARAYAGRLAQEKAGFEADSGWAADLNVMRSIATTYLVKYGLKDGLEAIRLNDLGEPSLSPQQRDVFDKEMLALFEEGKKMATERLAADWPVVVRVVADLLRKGEMSGDRFREIQLAHSKSTPCQTLLEPGAGAAGPGAPK